MSKHESHLVAVTINPSNATAKSSHQILHCGKQHIRQDRALQMPPQPFDHIQSRTIRWQPEQLNLIPMRLEPLPHRFGFMKPPVVTDQPNLPASIRGCQGDQEGKEVLPAFGLGHRIDDLAGLVIDPTVDYPLFVLGRIELCL
jgi:hypothetical protein